MKRLEATPREEALIAAHLGTSIRDLVAVIVAMVAIRLEGDELAASQAYREALDEVGKKYHPLMPTADLGCTGAIISSTRTQQSVAVSETPQPFTWDALIQMAKDEIVSEPVLAKFLGVAGYQSWILLDGSQVFCDDYAKHIVLFNRNAGVHFSFKRRRIGG